MVTDMGWKKKETTGDGGKAQLSLEYIARVLASAIFLTAAIGKVVDTAAMQGLMESVGVPGVLVWPAALLDLTIAISLISGYAWRIVLPISAVYCVFLGLVFHLKPESQNDMINLFKNLSLAGVLLLLAVRSKE